MEENENNDNSDQLEIIMNMNLKKKIITIYLLLPQIKREIMQ